MKHYPLLLLSFVLACCKNDATMTRDFSNAPTSTAFSAGQKTGVIQGDFVKELSGIAASSRQSGGYSGRQVS